MQHTSILSSIMFSHHILSYVKLAKQLRYAALSLAKHRPRVRYRHPMTTCSCTWPSVAKTSNWISLTVAPRTAMPCQPKRRYVAPPTLGASALDKVKNWRVWAVACHVRLHSAALKNGFRLCKVDASAMKQLKELCKCLLRHLFRLCEAHEGHLSHLRRLRNGRRSQKRS